jgi:hypothetical protein
MALNQATAWARIPSCNVFNSEQKIMLWQNNKIKLESPKRKATNSVADPHHVDADPNPACHFDADIDPYPTFHCDAVPDPDPNPSFQKCTIRLIFHKFWLVICKLMRIRIQLITLMRMRIRIQRITSMRIRIRDLHLSTKSPPLMNGPRFEPRPTYSRQAR